MRNGFQRLLDNAPGILVILAIVIFLGNMIGFRSSGIVIGYDGPQPLLRFASMIIASSYAPALLLGMAAAIDYLRTPAA